MKTLRVTVIAFISIVCIPFAVILRSGTAYAAPNPIIQKCENQATDIFALAKFQDSGKTRSEAIDVLAKGVKSGKFPPEGIPYIIMLIDIVYIPLILHLLRASLIN